MADKPGNAPTQQQVNDAQHLDNMTSLQQPSAAEQSPITQNGEVRGDAPVSAPPTPNPDNPSLFNEPKNPNNKVVEVESQKTTEFLEEGGITDTPSDQGSKFTEDLKGLSGDAINFTVTLDATDQGIPGDKPPELDPGVNKAGGNSGNQGPTGGGGGIPRPGQAPAGTPSAASPASPTSPTSQPNNPTQTVEPPRNVETAPPPPPPPTPPAPNPVTPQPLFVPEFVPEEAKVNAPSILSPDSQAIPEDSTAVGNVLTNDSDEDSALSVTSFSVNGVTYAPGQTALITGIGTVTIAADGSYLFTPEPNWNGVVPTIDYTTNTEKQSTLNILVTPDVDTVYIQLTDNDNVNEATGQTLDHTLKLVDKDGHAVNLAAGKQLTVNLSYSSDTTDGSDFSTKQTSVTITGNGGNTYTFANTVKDDFLAEGTESYTVTISGVTDVTSGFEKLAIDTGNKSATGTIVDQTGLDLTPTDVDTVYIQLTDNDNVNEATGQTLDHTLKLVDKDGNAVNLAAGKQLTVNLSYSSDTTDGSDFSTKQTSVTITGNGGNTYTFANTVKDDFLAEGTESYTVTISGVTDVTSGFEKLAIDTGNKSATGTIVDQTGLDLTPTDVDTVYIQLTDNDNVNEATGQTLDHTLKLVDKDGNAVNLAAGKQLTVNLSYSSDTTDGSDFSTKQTSVTITGNGGNTYTFANTVKDDFLAEGTESYTVTISGVTDVTSGFEKLAIDTGNKSATGTIVDQTGLDLTPTDVDTVYIQLTDNDNVNEATGQTLDHTLKLVDKDGNAVNLAAGKQLTVNLSYSSDTTDGSDFSTKQTSVTITGNGGNTYTFANTVKDDFLAEGTESYTVTISGVTDVTSGFEKLAIDTGNKSATGTIVDQTGLDLTPTDVDTVYIQLTDNDNVNEATGQTLDHTLKLVDKDGNAVNLAAGKQLTVNLSYSSDTTDGSDFSTKQTSVTITGNGGNTYTFANTVKDDFLAEGTESYTVTISGVTDVTSGFEKLAIDTGNKSATGTIVDQTGLDLTPTDVDTVYIQLTDNDNVNEATGQTLDHTLKLVDKDGNAVNLAAGKQLTVNLSYSSDTTDGSDFSTKQTSVTITGNGGNTYTFANTVKDDFLAEGTESYTVTISGVTDVTSGFEKLAIDTGNKSATGTIVDQTGLDLTPTDVDTVYIQLTDNDNVNEATGQTLDHTLKLVDKDGNAVNLAAGKQLTVNLSYSSDTTDGSDFSTKQTSVTITGNGGNTYTFANTVKDDFLAEGTESYTVTISGVTDVTSGFEKLAIDTGNKSATGTIVDQTGLDLTPTDVDTVYIQLTDNDNVNEATGQTLDHTLKLVDKDGNAVNLAAGKQLTVNLSYSSDTTDGSDFSTKQTSVTITGNGGNTYTFANTVKDDFLAEGTESYTVTISGVTDVTSGFEKLAIDTGNKSATGTIVDQTGLDLTPTDVDTVYIQLTDNDNVNEATGQTLDHTLKLVDKDGNAVNLAAGKQLTVNLSYSSDTTDGSDFSTKQTSVTITGNGGNTYTFANTVKDDFLAEGTESYTVTISGVTDVTSGFEKLAIDTGNKSATGTIVDQTGLDLTPTDVDTVYIQLTDNDNVNEATGQTLDHTLKLVDKDGHAVNLAAGKQLTVNLSYSSDTTDGSDFSTKQTSVTITGNGGNTYTFANTVKDDFLAEGTESYTVTISGVTDVTSGFEKLAIDTGNKSATGTIVDQTGLDLTPTDVDTVYIQLTDNDNVNEATGQTLDHTLKLVDKDGNAVNLAAGKQLTVNLSYSSDTTDGSDFSTKQTSVTITGNGGNTYTFANTVKDDFLAEGTESYTVTISGVTDVTSGFEKLAIDTGNKSATGTIVDNDIALVSDISIWKSGKVYDNIGLTLQTNSNVDFDTDFIQYTVIVKNTGENTLTGIKITDEKLLDGTYTLQVGTYNSSTDIFIQSGSSTILATALNSELSLGSSNLLVGQALRLVYVYDVNSDDLFSKTISNTVQIDTTQTDPEYKDTPLIANDGIATYEILVDKPINDVAIRKFADERTIEVGKIINYKLIITNEGTTNLTGVKVSDKMFATTADANSALDGKQISGTIYNADGTSVAANFNYVDGNLLIGDLGLNKYIEINYSHTVTTDDLSYVTTGLIESIFDYTGVSRGPYSIDGNTGTPDPITMSYGTFSAYVNTNSIDPYAIGGTAANIFINTDNTGMAIGVNAGVMSGDRNYNSDHLKAVFNTSALNNNQSLVEKASIVFTNAKDVEVAFKASYGVLGASAFTGSIIIANDGTVSLREVVNGSLSGASTKSGNTTTFTNSLISFTVDEAMGPGGAQNKLYTLKFDPGADFVKDFDFWVVGDPTDNSSDQIKVVDVIFDSIDFTVANITNTAIVVSNEDNASEQSDEIASVDVAVLTNLSGAAVSYLGGLTNEANLVSDIEAEISIPSGGVAWDYAKTGSTKTVGITLSGINITDLNNDLANRSVNKFEYTFEINGSPIINPKTLTSDRVTFDISNVAGLSGNRNATFHLYAIDNDGGRTEFSKTFIINTSNDGVTGNLTAFTTVAPIALDLNGNGVSYLSQEAGVTFDYNHDGVAESTAWVASEDGLLALQRSDGTHNIVFSTQAGETDLQGLAKVYDTNFDKVLDAQDAGFNNFGVWQDANSDGIVQEGEFKSLSDRGIISLSLTSDGVIDMAADGDVTIYGQTTYTMTDGSIGIAEDVAFAVSSVVTDGDGIQDTYQIASVADAPIVVDHFSADDRDRIDLSSILNPTNSVQSTIAIDADGSTSTHSIITVNIGGVDYEVATLYGKEIGVADALGTHPGGASLTDSLNGASWTDVVDISSEHGGPASIFAEGGSLTNSYSNEAGDWTVQIKSGTATVDAANKQITFSSDNAENLAIITTADGTSHEIANVDKILWH